MRLKLSHSQGTRIREVRPTKILVTVGVSRVERDPVHSAVHRPVFSWSNHPLILVITTQDQRGGCRNRTGRFLSGSCEVTG